jgi:hypothetical protein
VPTAAMTPQAFEGLIVQSAVQFAEGKTRKEVIARLVMDGCPPDVATVIADRAEEIKKSEFRKSARKGMLVGAGFAAFGIAVTAISYQLTSPGGSYLVASGAIFWGGWVFFKSLWRSMAG